MNDEKASYEARVLKDSPQSSSESAMQELEREIMAVEETFAALVSKLKPVLSDGVIPDNNETQPSVREPQSPIAQSITEKTSRLRIIRDRIVMTHRTVDL